MDLTNLTGKAVGKAMLANMGLGAATGLGYILVVGAGMLIANAISKKMNKAEEEKKGDNKA